jgi:glucan phosphoethanolaminetransferase (alkaline phosphatase superfamily)
VYIEFFLLSVAYKKIMRGKNINLIISSMQLILFVFWVVDISWLEGLYSNVSILRALESLLLTCLSLLAFNYLLTRLEDVSLTSNPVFWFNTAILIYFAGNFFVFLFMNYINNPVTNNMGEYLAIHSILNIIYNILLSIGIWNLKQK